MRFGGQYAPLPPSTTVVAPALSSNFASNPVSNQSDLTKASVRMTPTERRATQSLAGIFALRMLGLFLILPVFALEARKYPGGDDPALVGMTMGIYGLTQGLLQIPFGMASDRLGRKRVIVTGLLIFAAGSFLAAWADSLMGLLIGRSLQGAGNDFVDGRADTIDIGGAHRRARGPPRPRRATGSARTRA